MNVICLILGNILTLGIIAGVAWSGHYLYYNVNQEWFFYPVMIAFLSTLVCLAVITILLDIIMSSILCSNIAKEDALETPGRQDEQKSKSYTCKYCGEKIPVNSEMCPFCGEMLNRGE